MKKFRVTFQNNDHPEEIIDAASWGVDPDGFLVFFDAQSNRIATVARGTWLLVEEKKEKKEEVA